MKAMTPVTEIEGVERVFVPVFRDRDYSPEAIALRCQDYTSENGTEGFRNAYADILERGAGAYRRILLHLRDSRPPEKEEGGEEGEACLLHCTAGKDRTGVMVALVLQLVGVEDQVIAEEYALTEMGLADWKETILDHLMKDVGMHGGREGVERMIGAR